jgi:hypothetical protein
VHPSVCQLNNIFTNPSVPTKVHKFVLDKSFASHRCLVHLPLPKWHIARPISRCGQCIVNYSCSVIILLLLTYFLAIWKVTIVITFLFYCCSFVILLLLAYLLDLWKVTTVMFSFLFYFRYSLIADMFPGSLDSDNCFSLFISVMLLFYYC